MARFFATEDVVNRAFCVEHYQWAVAQTYGRDVLDIACGVGCGSAMLSEAISQPNVLGVDCANEAIAIARKRYGSERVLFEQIEDVETFATERRFDIIVSLETIEHLVHPIMFLKRMHSILRPGGKIVVSTTICESPGENLFRLHCFTPDTLRSLLAEGFVIEAEFEAKPYLAISARRREEPFFAWRATLKDAPPLITIALVTWNSLPHVVDLISALRAYTRPPYDLIIADNASTDGTRSYLKLLRNEPGVRIIENAENLQCAAAMNQLISLARTEYLVYLCVSHTLVTAEGWDEELVLFMNERPEVAMAGDLWNVAGCAIDSSRYAPDWTPESYGLNRLGHVQGGAFIVRRAVFDEIGAYDAERYPQSLMDIEFSYRIISYGKKLDRAPSIAAPQPPEIPNRRDGVSVYHPASNGLRAALRREMGFSCDWDFFSILSAFFYSCGYEIQSLENEMFFQHLVYIAEATQFEEFQYDFIWLDHKWPQCAELALDLRSLLNEIENERINFRPLPDSLMAHLEERVIPLIAEAKDCPAGLWITILARIHFMVTRQLNTPEEAIEAVEDILYREKQLTELLVRHVEAARVALESRGMLAGRA